MPCTQRRISVTVTGSVSWPPPRRWPRWRSTSVVSNPTTSSLAMAPPSRGAGSPAPAHSMGDGRSGGVAPRAPAGAEPLRLDRTVWLAGIGVAAVLMAFASRYGYHRDELYFLDCGRH